MLAERFSWAGLLFRFLAALLLVYATYNPEGYSFFHWAVEPVFTPSEVAVGGSVALKFFSGSSSSSGGWSSCRRPTARLAWSAFCYPWRFAWLSSG